MRHLSLAVASSYPGILYIFSKTRGNRDDPAVIKQRLLVISVYTVAVLVIFHQLRPEIFALVGLGFSVQTCIQGLALTILPFIGPMLFQPPELDDLKGIQGVRNIVVGPFTEELIYRGILGAIYKYNGASDKQIVREIPLYFGVAHLHHAIQLVQEGNQVLRVLIVCGAHFFITWLFGSYAAYIWLKFGSVWPGLLAHSFCNWVGTPPMSGEAPLWYKPLLFITGVAFFTILIKW